MLDRIKRLFPLMLLSLLPTLFIWLPFFVRAEKFWGIPLPQNGMATIVSNFDGPLYIVAAKTLYNPELISKNYQFPLTEEYYSAHFPLFPMFIKLFSIIIGSPYAMLFVTIFSSFMALFFFNKHALKFLKTSDALWLTAIFAIFPARWLVVRSVGSPEPLFIAAILASTYYFGDKKYWLAGFWGLVAQLTKSPAILLFVAYATQIFVENIKNLKISTIKKYIPLFLIPFGVLIVFSFYKLAYGDFWVYFKSGDNMHLFFPPFQIFNYAAAWVGTFWLEEILFIYLIGVLGVYKLFQDKLSTYFYFSLVFFAPLLFVAHRDLMRYSLPLVPFLLLGFRETLIKKEFKIAMAIIIIPIYLYSLAFISQNAMPIANWEPFL